MTYNEAYRQSVKILSSAGVEAPAFDAMCLFEKVFGLNRQERILNGNKLAEENGIKQLLDLSHLRGNGEPLQYILGKWYFMDCEFFVGKGVLIPREDTEAVVNLALSMADKSCMKIIDLCAGSGAISVALAKNLPDSFITAIELSDDAFTYLKKNIAHNKCKNVNAVKGNVFTDYSKYERESFNLIISNPPYIVEDEIKNLQKEVQREPFMALSGGKDGYDFYKAIINHWSGLLKAGGVLAFELGENQSDTVKRLMIQKGFGKIKTEKDMGGITRAIAGVYKCK